VNTAINQLKVESLKSKVVVYIRVPRIVRNEAIQELQALDCFVPTNDGFYVMHLYSMGLQLYFAANL
jgi:hypothetical protein